MDPYAYVYDESGKFVATTSNIGRITSMSVDDYGRNITTDTTLNPEIHPVVRLVVGNVTGTFVAGDVVYEGTDDYRTSFGTVVAYEEERQILSLETVEGDINKGKTITSTGGATAKVLVDNTPRIKTIVGTSVLPPGRFDSDLGMIGSKDSAIHDSLYYQSFSYEIESQLQQIDYETVVRDTVHPAGFAMFSVLKVNEGVSTRARVEDVQITQE